MRKREKIRLGLIGIGWIGSEHARNILANPKALLAGIADTRPQAMTDFQEKHNLDCRTYADYRQLLKSDIDAVVIASPNRQHAEMSVAAAKQGKHIYCEKPMAITAADCRRIRDAVEKARVKYLIGYHRRLNPLYQYARNLLDEGKLGKPFMIESDYLHYIPGNLDIWSWLGKNEIAGSILHAGGGHNVDLIRYYFGDIREVSCFKGIMLPRKIQVETEDTAIAIFKFKNGALGKVQCCVGPILPFTFNLRLYGTKGSVVNNRIYLDSRPRFDETANEKDCLELPSSWIPDNVQGGISEPWGKLMDHFVDMLVENKKSINDVESAYKTSIACFAAVKSAETGKTIDVERME